MWLSIPSDVWGLAGSALGQVVQENGLILADSNLKKNPCCVYDRSWRTKMDSGTVTDTTWQTHGNKRQSGILDQKKAFSGEVYNIWIESLDSLPVNNDLLNHCYYPGVETVLRLCEMQEAGWKVYRNSTLLLQLFVSLKSFQNENLKMTNPGCRAARWT